jgi:hypothetical protein
MTPEVGVDLRLGEGQSQGKNQKNDSRKENKDDDFLPKFRGGNI